jgi:TRAP transporter TAXI family solute receptor
MKLSGKLFAAALAGAMLAGAAAQAQEMKFFRIGTGSAGGTYFPIGGIIANAISNPPGSRPCEEGGTCGVPGLVAIAQSTNASAHNVTAINAGQMEAGLTGAATLYFAYHGEAKFKDNQKPKLRIIANLFPEDLHLVLPKDKKLASLKDLEGKRVGIAQAGSGTQSSCLPRKASRVTTSTRPSSTIRRAPSASPTVSWTPISTQPALRSRR